MYYVCPTLSHLILLLVPQVVCLEVVILGGAQQKQGSQTGTGTWKDGKV